MGEDGAQPVVVQALNQRGRDTDQWCSRPGAAGEGVEIAALVDPDPGHGDAGRFRDLTGETVQPLVLRRAEEGRV